MGCWNKTCGLSSLHITAGTPVYVFVLEDKPDDSNCYSTSLYRPLLLPFESKYNDYGGGENSSGAALPFVLKGIKDELVEMPLGENTYHDIEVTKEAFDEELFFEAVHEGRLSIQGRFRAEPTKLQFTMFRKDIVDNILAKREIVEYVGDGNGNYAKYNAALDYERYYFKDIIADIKPMLEIVKAKLAEAKEEGGAMTEYMLFSGFDGFFDWKSPNKAARWMRGDNYRYSRIVDMQHCIRYAFKSESDVALDKLAELIEVHLLGKFIDSFMEAARKTWIPGGHEGSQSDSGGALRLLGASINQALDIERAQWEEDTGEEYAE